MKKIILVLVCLSLHIFFSYPLKADQPKAFLQEANRYVFQAVNLSDKIEAIYLYGITHFPSDKTYVIGLEQSLADFYIEYKYYFEYDTGKGGVVSNPSPNPTAFTTSETCNTSGYFSGPAGEGWIRVTTTAQQDPDCCEEIQVQRVDTSSFVWEAILFKIVYDILPVKDWSPDEVKLNILDSSNDVVFSTNLTNSPGNNKTYLWNGKDNTGALVVYGDYKVKIKVKEGSSTMETEEYQFTVYQINVGDAVYRDKTGGQNHAGLLYGYTGENVKTDLLDYSKYTVTHIAGTGHVVEEVTLTNFIGEWGYYGPYNPSSFSRGPRKAVCYTANNLLGKDYCISQPLVYYGDTWEGTPEDIKKIRCN